MKWLTIVLFTLLGSIGFADDEPTDDEADFYFEIVHQPAGKIVTESMLDNIDIGKRLKIQRPDWHHNPEFYLSTKEREEIDEDTLDAFINAGEDLLSYRVENSRVTLVVLRGIDWYTPFGIDIENRQPDGPGTPNEFSIDISIQWKKLLGLKPKKESIAGAASTSKKKKYELSWGPRIEGFNKPPSMRIELLFANGGKPIEYDLTADPFDSEIELAVKRLHSPQGTDIRLFWKYGEKQTGTSWRLWINDSLSFRPSGGYDYGNNGLFVFIGFQASFSDWRDVFRGSPPRRTIERRKNLQYAAR